MLRGGGGVGVFPQKNFGLNDILKLCNSRHQNNMELLFKNARDVKWIFRDDLEKGTEKKTDAHCIFFDLGSDWDFSNIDSVFNTGERSEQEKFDYKKSKNNH